MNSSWYRLQNGPTLSNTFVPFADELNAPDELDENKIETACISAFQ